MSISLNPLEQRVMEMLLSGDDPILDVLREQFHAAHAVDRDLTGVGFFLTFSVPSSVRRVEGTKLPPLGDVKAEIEGLQYGAGFVLFFRDGAIDVLEGYTYDEPWPATVSQFHVSYLKGDERDVASLWKDAKGQESEPDTIV